MCPSHTNLMPELWGHFDAGFKENTLLVPDDEKKIKYRQLLPTKKLFSANNSHVDKKIKPLDN